MSTDEAKPPAVPKDEEKVEDEELPKAVAKIVIKKKKSTLYIFISLKI
jgi:hypothetical protein